MKKLCQLSLLLACLALVCLIQGCAVYSTASDERLVDTMGSDNAISGLIKKDLMAERFADGWNISVHCFYGHVFLVGECPKEMRAKAVKIAKRDKRVRSVTTHWFSPRVAETNNLVMATKLRSALIGTGNLNSTRIETEVNSDRVVLLGVANDSNERKTAVRAAREVNGVLTVTSYIMLPMKPGSNFRPTGITYQGFHQPKSQPKAPRNAGKTQAKPQKAKPAKSAPQGQNLPDTAPDTSPEGDTPFATPDDTPYGDIDNV
ncbi:MAG: BON domain-containing protein [Candidatus Desulfovibrio faecigallinarum]|nr:BON domain-containing protein [Candidatus Desulfovibrio faecigallinarum]